MRKLIESFFTLCVFKYTTVVILPRMVWGCQESIFSDFPSYRLENKSIWVVCRVEFDGDIRFFLEHQKSMFLLICIDFFDVFCNFFVFQVLQKTWFFFSVPPPSRSGCRRRRGGRRGRRRGCGRDVFFKHFFRFLAAVRSTPPKIEKNAKFNFFVNFFVEQASQLSPLPTRQEKKYAKKKIAERFFFWRHPLRVTARLDESTVIFFVIFRWFFR